MKLEIALRLFVSLCALATLADCASPSDCRAQFPRSQTLSQPCCPGWGVDACGAGLFCAALDGRTQATCYFEHSRTPGQECTADNQCASLSCNTTLHQCRYLGQGCDPCVGCAPLNGMQIFCDTSLSTPTCLPGTTDTEHSPLCQGRVDGGSSSDASADVPPQPSGPTPNIDLLVEIDNSGSMRQNQTNLMAQLGSIVSALHDHDLHVGVISTDLGTPGSSVPGCANSDLGDDGLLNPIRYGQALARHEPWTSAPPTFGRPTDCTDPNQYPSFITFSSGSDVTQFTHDFQCNAGLYVNGCGLESQLDAIYRALITHDASDSPANTSPNAGFLRSDSILGILVLSDEEDGSVRDCRFADGTACEGVGRIDVYNPASTAWANMELNLRFYMYQPCGPQDPTWPLSRYVDPANPGRGLLALKPGHPERIVFAAITGVPLATSATGTNWDQLLGMPRGAGPDDFCGRDSSGLGSLTSAEGPVSMAQANSDPGCSQRVVPACRREGSTYNPSACTSDVQYFAWPARRIVEIARRFSQSPLCGGNPCENGFVGSICSDNYSTPLLAFAARITERANGQ